MAFIATSLIGADLTKVYDTAAFAIGTRVRGKDSTYGEGEFVFLKGLASTAAGDVFIYDETGITTRAVAGSRGPVAVAMAATVASTYGFYQVRGAATVNVAGAVADNARPYLTATAGSLDDAVVATDGLDGARFRVLAGGAGTTQMVMDGAGANGNG